jgi:hypothetical protein
MEDVQVERGSEDLAAGWSRMAVTRVERRGTRMEYATRERHYYRIFLGDTSEWPSEVVGPGPASVNRGRAAGSATVSVNRLTEAGHVT